MILPRQSLQMTSLAGKLWVGNATAQAISFLLRESAGLCVSAPRRAWSSAGRILSAETRSLSPGIDGVCSHRQPGTSQGWHRLSAGTFAALFLNNSIQVRPTNSTPGPQCSNERNSYLRVPVPKLTSFPDSLHKHAVCQEATGGTSY